MPRWTYLLVRVGFAMLVLIGLTSAAFRSVALGVTEPEPARRAAFVAKADQKFAAHPNMTLLHILTGAGFLAVVPLQLTRRVRTQRPEIHRGAGRVAIILALASGLTGLFFGLRQPLAGAAEQVIISAAGLFLLAAVSLAFVHIRAGHVAQHREWMLRAIAAALGIASVRIFALPLDLTLSPRGVEPRVIFGLALWLGWGVTLAVAEAWIRATRQRPAGAA